MRFLTPVKRANVQRARAASAAQRDVNAAPLASAGLVTKLLFMSNYAFTGVLDKLPRR